MRAALAAVERGSPISIGGSWPSSTIERSLSVGPAARAMRAAEVVTFALVRSLAVPALAVPLVPASPRPRNAPAGASRPKPWLLCGGRAVVDGVTTPIIPRLGPAPARIATLLQKQFDTENPSTYISPTDGGGAVAAGAASGLRDDLEKRSSLLGSGGRAVSVVPVCGLAAEFGFTRRFARGVWLQRSRR